MRLPNKILIATFILLALACSEAGALTIKTNYVNRVNPDAPARKTSKGMIIVGTPDTVRVFAAFSVATSKGENYANSANKLQEALGEDVQVYCMPVPTAAEFYTPDTAATWLKSQCPAINRVFASLDRRVKGVDVYTPLSQHVTEPIYLRTDHHWAPLAAYYAAREFARVAKVPFRSLSEYEPHVIDDFVGTMRLYAKEANVEESPEQFVYYTPRNASYTVMRNVYEVKNQKVLGESGLMPSDFFIEHDGHGSYLSFMDGDYNNTQITTNVNNHRRLLIIKDSYGNPLPAYLFFSFEQIHVVDFRYFNHSLQAYVAKHGITDVLMVNVLEIALSDSNSKRYEYMLNVAPDDEDEDEPGETNDTNEPQTTAQR